MTIFDLIPKEYYFLFYYNVLLVIGLLTILHSQILAIDSKKNKNYILFTANLLFIFVLFYIGLRPINSLFVDMIGYNEMFEYTQQLGQSKFTTDVGFNFFLYMCTKVMTSAMFVFSCSFIYVVSLYIASRKLFKDYWFYSFLMLVGSFSFMAYGTNGIRNGMATSIVVLALAYTDKKLIMFALMALAISFHKTMFLPVMAYVISLFLSDSKKVFYFWFLCIPLSLLGGSFFETTFASLGFGDDRIDYLTTAADSTVFSHTGFRWDFLLYSAMPVFAGWYFTFKKKFNDPFYHKIFSTYLIANGFWVLVIRASFSNRFAYLSWFMMGLVIVYPFLKQRFFKKQHEILAVTILLYFMFTYVMNVFLGK